MGDNKFDRAAILLLTLETSSPGILSKIMGIIGEDKAKLLLERISQTGKVTPEVKNEVINDFYSVALDKQYVFGGFDVSSKILKESFGINKAKEFFKSKKEKFKFMEDVDIKDLQDFLLNETDQMKLFIFNYLSAKKASELLMYIDDKSFTLKLMKGLELPNPELLYDFEMELSAFFGSGNYEKNCHVNEQHVEKLASAIEFLPGEKRKDILQRYEIMNNDFYQKLKQLIFTFDDFLKIDDKTFKTVLFEVSDYRIIALCRLNTDTELVDKIDRCLTERTKSIVESESIGLGKTARIEQIDEAKRQVIATARNMEKKGGIVLNHG